MNTSRACRGQLGVLEQLRAWSSDSHNLFRDTGLHHRLKSSICHKFKIKMRLPQWSHINVLFVTIVDRYWVYKDLPGLTGSTKVQSSSWTHASPLQEGYLFIYFWILKSSHLFRPTCWNAPSCLTVLQKSYCILRGRGGGGHSVWWSNLLLPYF